MALQEHSQHGANTCLHKTGLSKNMHEQLISLSFKISAAEYTV